jgi:hypothetical protein
MLLCNKIHKSTAMPAVTSEQVLLREEGWLEVMYDRDKIAYSQFLTMLRSVEEKRDDCAETSI